MKNTEKVIDFIVKSSYCQSCTFWKNKKDTPEYFKWSEIHEESYTINHFGSAEKMKVDSIIIVFKIHKWIWCEIHELHQLCDLKTFKLKEFKHQPGFTKYIQNHLVTIYENLSKDKLREYEEAHITCKMAKIIEQNFFEEEEGLFYGANIVD